VKVAALDTMDRASLVAVWLEIFGTPVPKALSQTFLRRFLATEVQTRRFGGLPRHIRTALAKGSDHVPRPKCAALQPGGRLLREWNGITHVVDVTKDEFLWKGQSYRSLSAIAREITGAHWSGPRFFGLNGKAKA